jgi:PhzF family phenazine biosynthesis protein
VLDADDIDPAEMQQIASWTNLSETTFLQRPTDPKASYTLRIFTPTDEIPFAGHPTVGSAHAALEAEVVEPKGGHLYQECGAGVLELTVEGDGPDRLIFLQAPPPKILDQFGGPLEALSGALGGEVAAEPAPTFVDVGIIWLVAFFDDEEAVRRLQPDMTAVSKLGDEFNVPGVACFALGGEDGAAIRVRCFAPKFGIAEDPVTGSANACIGRYLAETGLIEKTGREYVSSQGTEMGRDGRLTVRVSDDGMDVQVGGQAVTSVDGTISV